MSQGTPETGNPVPLEAGLYLVATPIGNLEDITLRALRILRGCDLVAAEDTRRVRKLLNHFGISVKTISFREQNRARETPRLIERIRAGAAVALVSDAGTPCVSDPGAELVAACAEAGVPLFSVPGASAVTAAVAVSGFPSDRFAFIGFPPVRRAARRKLFAEIRARQETLVLFEAPHRIVATLEDAIGLLGDRPAVATRELTKLHEERLAPRLSAIRDTLLDRGEIKGEFTLVVAGAGHAEAPQADLSDEELRRRYEILLSEGVMPNDAVKLLASAGGRNRRDLYRLLRSKTGEEKE